MKDQIRTKLDAAFQRHEATTRAAAEAKQTAESREQAFLRAFSEASDAIIRPAMEEVGEYIKAKGYRYEISTKNEQVPVDGRGRTTPASIEITFLLGEKRYISHEHPSFAVICEKTQQRIRFHESTMSPGRGGHSGSAGDAALGDITSDLIQEKILKVLTQVFR